MRKDVLKLTKKLISVVLCLTLLASIAAVCFPANAAVTEDEATGYNRTAPLDSADDFTWDNASVYFLLTDRFYNGNTSNDHSYGRATDANGNALSGWNTSPGTFHGGDFVGITKKINEGYFDNLGVNAIWISAPYEQIHGYVTPGEGQDFAHYSYHGYYVLDYTEPDANFGTKEEFKTMVDTAHQHGIRIVMDIVMNHAGYNTIKDMIQYNFGTFKDKSAAQSYLYKINGVNGLHDYINYDETSSDWGRWWGSGWVRSGLPGYSEGGGGDLEMCLAGLPDFKTESTSSVNIPTFLQTKWQGEGTKAAKLQKYGSSDTVSNYLVKWLSEWVSTYGVDGFRCDTAKHVEDASWKKLKTNCVSALKQWRQNNPTSPGADWDEDFWMTGEAWGHGLGYSHYYSDGGFDSMINFSFSGAGVNGVEGINGVYQNYASTINNQKGFNALTYISSHDSNLARSNLAYQGSAFQLMPGGIQIFYGDESNRPLVSGMNFDGNGGSGHSLRSDMNWNSMDNAMLSHWQKVGKFRRNHVAVGAGDHQQITAYNTSTGYTFERSYDDGMTSDGVICTIGAPANQQIAVDVSSIWNDGKTVTNAYDGKTAVVQNGKATFNSGAYGTILIEGPMPTIHMSIKGNYSFYDSETVTVSLRGADYAMVKVNGGQAFRVVDGQTFEIGNGIELGEVFPVEMTATNSEETATKTFKFKRKDPNAITKLYFDNTKYKWSPVTAYVYAEDSTGNEIKNAEWPGVNMTYDKETGFYVYEVPDGLENGRVIFSSNGNNQYPGVQQAGLEIQETNKLFLHGERWKDYEGEKADPDATDPPVGSYNVYLDNSTTNFSNPYIYYWRSATNTGDDTWPGIQMTKYKGNVYVASIPSDHDMCIFSDNGGSQTSNQTIPGANYIYKNGSWEKYADAADDPTQPTDPPQGDKILIGDINMDGVISVGDATLVQKAAAEMVDLNANQTIAADCNGDKVVSIADATLIQKYAAEFNEDLKLTGTYTGGGSQPSTQPSTEPAEKNYIYFKNSDWSTPTAYYWSDANEHMLPWPGNAMTNIGNNVYRIEVPSDAEYIIFSNNGSNQTGDIRLEGFNKLYENNGWATYYNG